MNGSHWLASLARQCERDNRLVALLPAGWFTSAEAASAWGIGRHWGRVQLRGLVAAGLLCVAPHKRGLWRLTAHGRRMARLAGGEPVRLDGWRRGL